MSASVDYGYGDSPDYGYGDSMQQDYGYGEPQPDYGYGEPQPDYGYGDSKPKEADYAYGDSAPSDEYGYGDAKPDDPVPQEDRRPKRRCSVTRYSIAPQSAPLNAAAVINDLRNGADVETLGSEQAPDDEEKTKSKGRFKGIFRRGK